MNLILFTSSLAVAAASAQLNGLRIRRDLASNNTGFPCLYMTNDINWQGEGQNLCQFGGQCAGLLPDGLTANASSAGPSEGQTCFLYTDENCGGTASPAFSYPGYSDLHTIGFFKKAKSWRCYMWAGYTSSISTITRTVTQTMARGTALNAAAAASTAVSITATLSGPQPTASPSGEGAGSSSTNILTTTEVVTQTETLTATKTSGTGGSGSAPAQTSSTGIWNGSSASFSVVMTHTFGGRGGSVTTLTTYMATR